MNNRHIKIKHPQKKKKPDYNWTMFLRRIERDEILLNKCEIPKDGDMRYCRPWKL